MSAASEREELVRLERVVADALAAPDPVAALRAAADDEHRGLPAELRRRLRLAATTHADGLRLGALLVAKLRFERLVQGSTRAAEWFTADPESFSRAFRAYHETVPPTERFPQREARAFEAWLDGRDG